MLSDKLAAMAYHEKPLPDDLCQIERMQYIMLRRVYAGYRSGEIDREEAQLVKEYIMHYTLIPYREKRSLLTYAFGLFCMDAGGGDREALRYTRELVRILKKL